MEPLLKNMRWLSVEKMKDASDNLLEKIIPSSTFQKTIDAHESRKFFFHEKILDESEMLEGLQIFIWP